MPVLTEHFNRPKFDFSVENLSFSTRTEPSIEPWSQYRTRLMDASILVVGDTGFFTSLQDMVPGLASCTVQAVANASEAVPIIHAQQPDLLVIQASQPGCSELCQQVKLHNQLAWMYCIVLDSQADKNGSESWQLRQAEVMIETDMLRAGADAYICLHPLSSHGSFQTTVNSDIEPELALAQQQLLVAQVQVGLQRVKTYRELIRTNDILSAIALSDPLTELNNRRAFEWELPRQIQNARTRGMPISLLMLDVDFFKRINDTYGHVVGDRALQLISARLRHNLRFYDTPFRYGGEEFVILLNDTGLQEAGAIAERICYLISDQPFTISDTLELHITISAGAASLMPHDDLRGVSLLHRADKNLFQAKAQGRNCAVSREAEETA